MIALKVDVDAKKFRDLGDEVMAMLKSGVVVLAMEAEGRCQIVAKVSDDIIEKHGIKANEIIAAIAPVVGGTGGGKSSSAQAGGKSPENIDAALAKARDILR